MEVWFDSSTAFARLEILLLEFEIPVNIWFDLEVILSVAVLQSIVKAVRHVLVSKVVVLIIDH